MMSVNEDIERCQSAMSYVRPRREREDAERLRRYDALNAMIRRHTLPLMIRCRRDTCRHEAAIR